MSTPKSFVLYNRKSIDFKSRQLWNVCPKIKQFYWLISTLEEWGDNRQSLALYVHSRRHCFVNEKKEGTKEGEEVNRVDDERSVCVNI